MKCTLCSSLGSSFLSSLLEMFRYHSKHLKAKVVLYLFHTLGLLGKLIFYKAPPIALASKAQLAGASSCKTAGSIPVQGTGLGLRVRSPVRAYTGGNQSLFLTSMCPSPSLSLSSPLSKIISMASPIKAREHLVLF